MTRWFELSTRRVTLVALFVTLLAGCGAKQAQNPGTALRPVNAVADGADERVILKGADVVAYFVDGKYVQAGSNSFWQRSKRLLLRVPHYKSGDELARMVAQAKTKKG